METRGRSHQDSLNGAPTFMYGPLDQGFWPEHAAAKLPGHTTSYKLIPLPPEAAALLRPGPNTIAIHCHQTKGGPYIGAGLIDRAP